jgi:hypothetical protein
MFSCFAPSDSFSAVLRATGPVFDGTEVVGSCFHVLRSRTHFRRHREWRVPFSCFALSDSFSMVPNAAGPFFMFCALGLIFNGTRCDMSRFHILRSHTHFRRTEGVESRFHILRYRTHFRRYRGRRVPFSCFALPDTF